jgi:DNA-3-methyladenine glycosylase II
VSTVTGPDFLALQVRDLERAAAFYEQRLGLRRAPAPPPDAVVFATSPVAFAVRAPLPGTDLEAGRPGLGVALWLGADDAQGVHDRLAADGVPIVIEPFDGPFGRTFVFRDPRRLRRHRPRRRPMTFALHPAGPFSLAAAAAFAEGFAATEAERAGGALRFAWAVDGDWRTAAVALRQPDGEGVVEGDLDGSPPPDLARRARTEVERILSLDVDGRGFAAVERRDPVVAALRRRFAGLRPVLFFSPYEAAAWCVIGHRIRITQAAAIKRRLAAELGELGAFPAPDRLAALPAPQRGLAERKVEQLRALGAAALDGALSRARLRALAPEDAVRELQRLPGVGSFAAELILVRGVGDPDHLPRHEPRLARAVRAAYDLPEDAAVEPVAEAWQPYRAWVALLLRAWLEQETGEIARGRRSERGIST